MIMKVMNNVICCLGSSTLPRATTRATETEGARATGTGAAAAPGAALGDKVAAATSSTSLYDNVSGAAPPAPATAHAAHTLPPKGTIALILA